MSRMINGVTALIVLTTSLANAQLQAIPEYSRSELQQKIANAHTAPEYRTLATYFRARQRVVEEQAQTEKAEWDRRSGITAATYQKFPRPADSSRNRYEYLEYQAQQLGQQAEHFESLLGPSRP